MPRRGPEELTPPQAPRSHCRRIAVALGPMMLNVRSLGLLLLVAVTLGVAGCATTVDDRFRVEVTGPGGLPKVCRLPDCAIDAEFDTVEEAVFAGIAEIFMKPDWRLREYAGCIFEERPEIYRVSHPVPKTIDLRGSRSFCWTPPAPAGTRLIAELHSHPTLEGFSDIDLVTNWPQYLLAPSRTVYRYLPATRTLEKWEAGRWVFIRIESQRS